MSLRTDTFDLGGLHLSVGEGRRLELAVAIEPLDLGGQRYRVEPSLVPIKLDVSRTTGMGYAVRLKLEAKLVGPCMRCLEPAEPAFSVEAREISQPGIAQESEPGASDELVSPYIEHGVIDLQAWARDALALALPATLLCRPECAGLCPVCGENLNLAGPDHHHERQPDPRWAKLSELRLE